MRLQSVRIEWLDWLRLGASAGLLSAPLLLAQVGLAQPHGVSVIARGAVDSRAGDGGAASHDGTTSEDGLDASAAGDVPETRAHRVSFELAALWMTQPQLFDLPLEAYGARATLGARVYSSPYFTYSPQLVLEHYRGNTPRDLAFTSTNLALAFDVAIALPWLHWDLHVGRGINSMRRATTDGSMSRWDDIVGIGVSAEFQFGNRRSVFVMLGERWLGDVESTVVGLGYRM